MRLTVSKCGKGGEIDLVFDALTRLLDIDEGDHVNVTLE
jgi:hypothetical protein